MGSLFKHPSPYTRVSGDGSWQGKSGGAQKMAERRFGEAWPAGPGWSRNRSSWRLPRVQNYFRLSLIQSVKGIPGPGPDGGLGTLMGNGLGLLAPSSLVFGTGLGEEGGCFKTKGFQVAGGRAFHVQTVRYMQVTQPGSLETGLLHSALPLSDSPGQIFSFLGIRFPTCQMRCLDQCFHLLLHPQIPRSHLFQMHCLY